jgi:hypothetical protein
MVKMNLLKMESGYQQMKLVAMYSWSQLLCLLSALHCRNTKTTLVNNVNKSLFHEMSPRSEVVDDSTDPGGTLQPKIAP